MRYVRHGVGAAKILAIAIYLVVAGGVGWYFYHQGQDRASSGNTSASTEVVDTGPTDFYSCFIDYAHKIEPAMPQTCTWKGKTYTRPAEFVDADVRNLDKVPASATQFVRDLAKRNFDVCKDVPTELSVTRVLGVAHGSYIYLVTGCDSPHAEVLYKQDGAWVSVVHTQNILSCEDVDKYKIPKVLFPKGASAQGTKCNRLSTGQNETIPY